MQNVSAPPLHIGVIGAGFHARRNILPALRESGATVAAVATRDLERSRQALRSIGSDGTPYDSAEALLADPTITSVAVITQPDDAVRLTAAALAAGKHVFADKPLGWSRHDAERLAQSADRAGVQLMVGFMKRYAPVVARLKQLLDSDGLGCLRSFHLRFGCDSSGFASDAEQFVKLAAIHHVDLVRHLFSEVEEVTGFTCSADRRTAVTAALVMRSGLIGTLELNGLSSYASETDVIRVSGDDGWAETDGVRLLRTHHTSTRGGDWTSLGATSVVEEAAISTLSGDLQDLHLRGFVGQFHQFARSVHHAEPAPSSGWDNASTNALCDQLLTGTGAAPQAPAGRRQGPALRRTLTFDAPGPGRDGINDAILSGTKTSSSNLQLVHDLRDDPVPRVGELRLLLDSSNRPVAEIQYDTVHAFHYSDLPDEVAAREGLSTDQWRHSHTAYWSSLSGLVRSHLDDESWTLTGEAVVVATTFHVSSVATKSQVIS